EARLDTLKERCQPLPTHVRIVAALHASDAATLYQDAAAAIPDVLGQDTTSSGSATFFAFLDGHGRFIDRPDSSSAGGEPPSALREGPWPDALEQALRLGGQHFGFLVNEGATNSRIIEIVLTPIEDHVTGKLLAAL